MRLGAALLLALLAVGCLRPGAAPTPATAGTLPDLSDLSSPAIDAHRARLWWEDFVQGTPMRLTGSPTNVNASERLEAELQAAGYETRVFYYTATPKPGAPPALQGGDPSPVPAGVRTLVGMKNGTTDPKHVLAWVAHYDSNRGTVYAAYDDGSGTAVAMELARVLAQANTSKTLMPIFFDGEEQGLVGSDSFVKQAMQSDEFTYDMVIGHDMTGINCPGHEWPMYQMVAEEYADTLVPMEVALYRDVLKLDVGTADMDTPTAEIEKHCVVVLNGHDRNSDERRFKEAGIPILRMAGGRKAVEYPAYHQANDTVEYVYQFAGSPEKYEQGLDLVVRASWYNVMVFDRVPPLQGGES